MKTPGCRRELAQGASMPFSNRVAWVDWSRRLAVCHPWPVSWLALQWREFAWRIVRAASALGGPGREEQEVADAQRIYRERQMIAEEYAAGYLDGWQECFDACMEAIEEELARGGLQRVAREAKTSPAGRPQSQMQDPSTAKLERSKLN